MLKCLIEQIPQKSIYELPPRTLPVSIKPGTLPLIMTALLFIMMLIKVSKGNSDGTS